jgi:hypothetical protein
MEAMPPNALPQFPHPVNRVNWPVQRVLDSAVRHPVFFTERLIKAPVGVNPGNTSWGSPVATGYVFEDGVRREAASRL